MITEILSLATPAVLSAVLGQVTYLLSIMRAGRMAEPAVLAAVGLGHATTQVAGIMPFLGLNTGLDT